MSTKIELEAKVEVLEARLERAKRVFGMIKLAMEEKGVPFAVTNAWGKVSARIKALPPVVEPDKQ